MRSFPTVVQLKVSSMLPSKIRNSLRDPRTSASKICTSEAAKVIRGDKYLLGGCLQVEGVKRLWVGGSRVADRQIYISPTFGVLPAKYVHTRVSFRGIYQLIRPRVINRMAI